MSLEIAKLIYKIIEFQKCYSCTYSLSYTCAIWYSRIADVERQEDDFAYEA